VSVGKLGKFSESAYTLGILPMELIMF